ncbi:hypothetical protein ACFQV2_15520 [Actinokineospora soli]|uniref:Mce-associated membrane protein n=1 Tax=Actinokineospora soli TaxID=1048753 RepID=A0ABW2TM33_9PSEU
MRATRTPVAVPRTRRPAVAGIRRPRKVSEVDTVAPEEVVEEPVEDLADAETEAEPEPEVEEPDDERPRSGLVLPIVLLVATAVLVAVGSWSLLRADDLTANANVALVDTGGTAEATRQVREGLEKVFSYRHDDTAATEEAARAVLTGAARDQYDRLFRQVREQAPSQRLTLTTRVVSSGLVSLRGDTAVLLVFLDQSAVRGDNGEVTTAGAQLSVTAVLVDGKWRISDLVPR